MGGPAAATSATVAQRARRTGIAGPPGRRSCREPHGRVIAEVNAGPSSPPRRTRRLRRRAWVRTAHVGSTQVSLIAGSALATARSRGPSELRAELPPPCHHPPRDGRQPQSELRPRAVPPLGPSTGPRSTRPAANPRPAGRVTLTSNRERQVDEADYPLLVRPAALAGSGSRVLVWEERYRRTDPGGAFGPARVTVGPATPRGTTAMQPAPSRSRDSHPASCSSPTEPGHVRSRVWKALEIAPGPAGLLGHLELSILAGIPSRASQRHVPHERGSASRPPARRRRQTATRSGHGDSGGHLHGRSHLFAACPRSARPRSSARVPAPVSALCPWLRGSNGIPAGVVGWAHALGGPAW